MQTSYYTITQLARAHWVSLRTLRFYEERGLLNPVRQGVNRIYSERDRIRLELILKGKKLGFTIREIEVLILSNEYRKDAPPTDAAALLDTAKLLEQITHLERKRQELVDSIDELNRALHLLA